MKRTVIVSDFSNRVIDKDKDLYTITLTPSDGRKAVIVADAHVEDKIVQDILNKGRQANNRSQTAVKTNGRFVETK